MKEIKDLVKNPPDGIRYTENDENTVAEIHAVIDGPGKDILALNYIRIAYGINLNKTHLRLFYS
jgi:ubiquitin-protein ligase